MIITAKTHRDYPRSCADLVKNHGCQFAVAKIHVIKERLASVNPKTTNFGCVAKPMEDRFQTHSIKFHRTNFDYKPEQSLERRHPYRCSKAGGVFHDLLDFLETNFRQSTDKNCVFENPLRKKHEHVFLRKVIKVIFWITNRLQTHFYEHAFFRDGIFQHLVKRSSTMRSLQCRCSHIGMGIEVDDDGILVFKCFRKEIVSAAKVVSSTWGTILPDCCK